MAWVGPAVSAGASLLGGITGGKGASKAAKIQADAYKQGIAEQQREFNTIQGNNAPYMAAGTSGLDQLLTLLGVNGSPGQQSAIDALRNSPLFTAPYQTGQDTILANASATGGLRGGNTEDALSRFGADLLNQVIGNQTGNLFNLTQIGQAAASGTNAAALSTGNNISNLLSQQGNALGSNALLQGAIGTQTIQNVGKALADYLNKSTG